MQSRFLTSVTSGLLVFGSGLLAPLDLAAADAPEIEWVRYLDEDYTGCVNAITGTTTTEGGFVFWGVTRGVLMKVDSRGDVVWTKCEGVYAVRNAQLDDDGLLTGFGSNPRALAYLQKLNRSGEMEWQIPYESTMVGSTAHWAQLGDGSHVVCGTTNEDLPAGFLQRISAAGVSEPPVMIPDRRFNSIIRTSDGGAFVLGEDPYISDAEETFLRFLKIDTAGAIERETSLLIPASGSALSPAIQLKSGDYVLGYSDLSNEGSGFYVRLDPLGNLISHQPMPPSVFDPSGRIELSNGDIVQVGTMMTGTGGHGYLARVTSDWETRWIVDVGRDLARNVQPTSDGGYLVHAYGTTQDGSSNTARLVKLGPDPLNLPTLFIRGDANGDGAVDIADPSATLGFLFLGDAAPGCLEAANTNDDGEVDISDAVHTLNYLFVGGAPIPPPFPEKGIDPTPGPPGCSST